MYTSREEIFKSFIDNQTLSKEFNKFRYVLLEFSRQRALQKFVDYVSLFPMLIKLKIDQFFLILSVVQNDIQLHSTNMRVAIKRLEY